MINKQKKNEWIDDGEWEGERGKKLRKKCIVKS